MWGKDHVMIYNDGYLEIAGNYHPRALGARVADIWPEIWDWNRTILEGGFRGEVQSFRDQVLTLYRHGEAENVVSICFIRQSTMKTAGSTASYAPFSKIRKR